MSELPDESPRTEHKRELGVPPSRIRVPDDLIAFARQVSEATGEIHWSIVFKDRHVESSGLSSLAEQLVALNHDDDPLERVELEGWARTGSESSYVDIHLGAWSDVTIIGPDQNWVAGTTERFRSLIDKIASRNPAPARPMSWWRIAGLIALTALGCLVIGGAVFAGLRQVGVTADLSSLVAVTAWLFAFSAITHWLESRNRPQYQRTTFVQPPFDADGPSAWHMHPNFERAKAMAPIVSACVGVIGLILAVSKQCAGRA